MKARAIKNPLKLETKIFWIGLAIVSATHTSFAQESCEAMKALDEIASLQYEIFRLENRPGAEPLRLLLQKKLDALNISALANDPHLSELRERLSGEVTSQEAREKLEREKELRKLYKPFRLGTPRSIPLSKDWKLTPNLKVAVQYDSATSSVLVMDVETGQIEAPIQFKDKAVKEIRANQISADGKYLAIDTGNLSVKEASHLSWFNSLKRSLLGTGGFRTVVFDLKTGDVVAKLKHTFPTEVSFFGPDGKTIYLKGPNAKVTWTRIWKFLEHQETSTKNLPIFGAGHPDFANSSILGILPSQIGLISKLDGGYYWIYDFANEKVITSTDVFAKVQHFSFSENGNYFASYDPKSGFQLWNLQDNTKLQLPNFLEEILQIQPGTEVNRIYLSKDGDILGVEFQCLGFQFRRVYLYSIKALNILMPIASDLEVIGNIYAFHPDGKHFIRRDTIHETLDLIPIISEHKP